MMMKECSTSIALQPSMAKASSQLEQLHISLSRIVTIRFADQQPLLAELREALQHTMRHAAVLLVSPLDLLFVKVV